MPAASAGASTTRPPSSGSGNPPTLRSMTRASSLSTTRVAPQWPVTRTKSSSQPGSVRMRSSTANAAQPCPNTAAGSTSSSGSSPRNSGIGTASTAYAASASGSAFPGLAAVSGVRQADIMAAFDISRPTLARAVKRYREHGEDAFFEPRRRRGRTVVDAQMAAKAAALLASGMSGSACARHLGIPPTTFNENRRAGVIAAPAPALAAVADAPQVATDHPTSANTEPAAATDRATRDARDKHAPMGRAARDVERRTLASAGLLTEATPVFAEPAHGVARGGVLAALPMLLREGLLDAANRLFRLPAGFYGLTTILLFVACLTLARVRNPEALRYQAPGEWGAILGLDRGPEPKTLRRKLRLLTSAEHTVRDWQAELARSWATAHDDDLWTWCG